MGLLLLLLGAVAAQETSYDLWVTKLAGDDADEQASARRILLNAGTRALPALREAQQAQPDRAARDRLAALVREIAEREPFGLRFRCGMPKMRLTRDRVNGDGFRYAVSVRNLGDEPVVLSAYLSLRVLDAQGNELKPSRRLGRWGLRRERCFLVAQAFETVEAGGVWSFQDGLARYMHDPELITGWTIPGPGTYTLEFTCRFDRAATKQRCTCGSEAHDDPAKPWNKALELKHTFTAEMKVE